MKESLTKADLVASELKLKSKNSLLNKSHIEKQSLSNRLDHVSKDLVMSQVLNTLMADYGVAICEFIHL